MVSNGNLLAEMAANTAIGMGLQELLEKCESEREALAARVEKLEQPARRCAKCGSTKTWVRWHWDQTYCLPDNRKDRACMFAGEHLHCLCPCGYEWSTPPLGAKETT